MSWATRCALLWLSVAVTMTWQAAPLTSSEVESRKAMANQLIAGKQATSQQHRTIGSVGLTTIRIFLAIRIEG
jgi:hypothetical protein